SVSPVLTQSTSLRTGAASGASLLLSVVQGNHPTGPPDSPPINHGCDGHARALGHPRVGAARGQVPRVAEKAEAASGVRDLLLIRGDEPRWSVPEGQRVAFEVLQVRKGVSPHVDIGADPRVESAPQRSPSRATRVSPQSIK